MIYHPCKLACHAITHGRLSNLVQCSSPFLCSCHSLGQDVIIATPGRLNDLVAINVIDVSSISLLILDEADRMLDLGFEPQVKGRFL